MYVVFTSEVKKHQIRLTLEEFVDICNLSWSGSNYDDNKEGYNFNFLDDSISFLEDPNTITHSLFIVGILHLTIHLIQYVVTHILFPRKSNSSHLIKSDIAAVWFLKNRVEKNWASIIWRGAKIRTCIYLILE